MRETLRQAQGMLSPHTAPLLLIPRCLVGNGFERMSRTPALAARFAPPVDLSVLQLGQRSIAECLRTARFLLTAAKFVL